MSAGLPASPRDDQRIIEALSASIAQCLRKVGNDAQDPNALWSLYGKLLIPPSAAAGSLLSCVDATGLVAWGTLAALGLPTLAGANVWANANTWNSQNLFIMDSSGSGFYVQLDDAILTANRLIAFPNLSGTVALTTGVQNLASKTLTVSNVIQSGTDYVDTSAPTKKKRDDFTGITAGNTRTFKYQDVSGAHPTVGKPSTAAAAGILGGVDVAAQTAAIGATNLTNASPAGDYLVTYTLEDTTADLAAGTIQFQIGYTDDVGATTQSGAALAMTATGRDRGLFVVRLASGNITYTTLLVGIIGTAAYALHVRVLFLG